MKLHLQWQGDVTDWIFQKKKVQQWLSAHVSFCDGTWPFSFQKVGALSHAPLGSRLSWPTKRVEMAPYQILKKAYQN